MRVAFPGARRWCRTGAHLFRANGPTWLGIVFILSACSSAPPAAFNPPFYERTLRQSYAITPDEIKTLQFYISGEVLAHRIEDRSPTATPDVVIVPAGTPGLVREVGSDWLRVAFTEGGEGVLFRLRVDRSDSVYALATTTESGEIVLVSRLPEPVLTTGGRRFKIVSGGTAYLLVNNDDLNRLLAGRQRPGGLQLPR
jgi:hypothetical protein